MSLKKSLIYAHALWDLDLEKEQIDFLKDLSDLFNSRGILDFFLSFTVSLKDKKEFLARSFPVSCPKILKNFFYVLLENKAFFLLPKIMSNYQNLIEEENKECRGLLYSPFPLSTEQKQELEELVGRFLNKKLELIEKEDKSLIAGFYIQTTDFLFDATIRCQLKQFERKGV